MDTVERRLGGGLFELVATESCTERSIREGQSLGYVCEHCGQGDETLAQVYHDAKCRHAGRHGRQYYDEIATDGGVDTAPGPSEDLAPHHEFTLIRASFDTAGGGQGIHRGQVLLWLCDECHNADESMFEIRHDEDCSLSGRFA